MIDSFVCVFKHMYTETTLNMQCSQLQHSVCFFLCQHNFRNLVMLLILYYKVSTPRGPVCLHCEVLGVVHVTYRLCSREGYFDLLVWSSNLFILKLDARSQCGA